MRYLKLLLTTVTCLISALLVFCLPHYSYATKASYTVQTGSFTSIKSAQNEFDSLKNRLEGKDLTYLRIEKIANFYSVRLGKFEDRESADKFLRKNKSKLADAIAKKAFIKEDRIVRLYDPSLKKKNRVAKKPTLIPVQKKNILKTPEETPEKTEKKILKLEPDHLPVRPEIEVTEKTLSKKITDRKAATLPVRIRVISKLVNQKEYQKALEVIKSEIAQEPDNHELNGWYGAVLLKMNSPEKAIKPLKKATELLPDIPDYHSVAGYCLFFLNRLDEAIEEFNKAITLAPSHLDALAGLGTAYAMIGDSKKASEIHSRLKKIDSNAAAKLLQIIKMESL